MGNEKAPGHREEQNTENMPETDTTTTTTSVVAAVVLVSLNVLVKNPKTFLSIFALTVLPLSLLLFAVSLSSRASQARILHLEGVASLSPTRFEARHVWNESRSAALSLLLRRLLFLLPVAALSLLALVSAASSTAASLSSAVNSLSSFKHSWRRVAITSVCAYGTTLIFGHAARVLTSAARGPIQALFLVLFFLVADVYLTAVLSLGLVVSVLEEKFGWVALRVGSDLMQGKRLCGWVLSGLLAAGTGFIRWELDGLVMNGRDELWGLESTAVMELVMDYGDKLGLTGVVWGGGALGLRVGDCFIASVAKDKWV